GGGWMNLSGTARPELPDAPEVGAPRCFLAFVWAALAIGWAEALEIRLRDGVEVEGVLALRIEGAVVEAATRAGAWTHAFRVDDVLLVRAVARGGAAAQRP
ncbi:MAG: hypothetical protein ACK4Z0_07090, partial [Sphingomonadaceae bacterium]